MGRDGGEDCALSQRPRLHKQIGVLVDEVEHSTTGLWLGPILLGVRGWEQQIDEALKGGL